MKIWGERHAPLGPREVRVILESCLHASTFLITASSSPDRCLCPSCVVGKGTGVEVSDWFLEAGCRKRSRFRSGPTRDARERDRARRLPRMPVRRSILAATIVLIAPGNSWSAGTAPWVQGIRSGGVGAGSKGLPPATPFSRRGGHRRDGAAICARGRTLSMA